MWAQTILMPNKFSRYFLCKASGIVLPKHVLDIHIFEFTPQILSINVFYRDPITITLVPLAGSFILKIRNRNHTYTFTEYSGFFSISLWHSSLHTFLILFQNIISIIQFQLWYSQNHALMKMKSLLIISYNENKKYTTNICRYYFSLHLSIVFISFITIQELN